MSVAKSKIIKDFLYVLRYYKLPRNIQQHIAQKGCIFSNGVHLVAYHDRVDVYNSFEKPEDKFAFDALEALHIYCLEI